MNGTDTASAPSSSVAAAGVSAASVRLSGRCPLQQRPRVHGMLLFLLVLVKQQVVKEQKTGRCYWPLRSAEPSIRRHLCLSAHHKQTVKETTKQKKERTESPFVVVSPARIQQSTLPLRAAKCSAVRCALSVLCTSAPAYRQTDAQTRRKVISLAA